MRLNCLHYVIVEMMSESESLTLISQGDEIWTEEEVIEFGLAGEEEYCDLETVETSIELPTMPDVTETAELVYLDDAESALADPDSRSSKKSGRVRTNCYCFIDNTKDVKTVFLTNRQSFCGNRLFTGNQIAWRPITWLRVLERHIMSTAFVM